MLGGTYSCISVRYTILACAFFGYNLIYIFRVNMGMAIVAMVNASDNDGDMVADYEENECRPPIKNSTLELILVERKPGEFEWDERMQGIILSSFFFAYGFGCLVGGRMAEKLGGKWVFGVGTGLMAVISLLTPWSAHLSVWALIAARGASGFLGGVAFPVMNTIIGRWMPKSERSRAFSILISGSRMGNVVGLLLTGVLCDGNFMDGWPASFYVFGIVGVVWFLIWILVMYETPSDHPRISEKELAYILEKQGEERVHKNPPIPYKKILTSVPVWVTVIASIGESWGSTTIPTSLPTYMANVLHLDLQESGFATALPCFLQTVCMWVSGYIADWILKKDCISRTALRKLMTLIGTILPAICLFLTTLVGCDWIWNLVLFVLAMGCNGFVAAGFRVSVLDIAPDFAGTIMGISVGVGNGLAFLSPYLVGVLTNNAQTLKQWHKVYWVCAGFYTLGGLSYLLGGSSELQSWGLYHAPESGVPKSESKKEEAIRSKSDELPETLEVANGVPNYGFSQDEETGIKTQIHPWKCSPEGKVI